MTRTLRQTLWGAATAALVMTCAASESFAVEPGDFTNYLRGASQGLPLGALPPPGLYGGFAIDATGAGSSPGKGNQSTGFRIEPGAGLRPKPSLGSGMDVLRRQLRRQHRPG